MLEEWEKKLFTNVLECPEIYDGNKGCNDWDFPSYMTRENQRYMVLKVSYANDNGEEIKEYYEGNDDLYLESCCYLSNYEVPFYFRIRMKELGVI